VFGWCAPRTQHWEFVGYGLMAGVPCFQFSLVIENGLLASYCVCRATEEDQIWWMLESSGKYTAKSAYNVQRSIASNLTLWCIWKQRNAAVFMSSICSQMQVVAVTRDDCSLWASAEQWVPRPLAVANNLVSN